MEKRGFVGKLRALCFLSVLILALLFVSQSALADEVIVLKEDVLISSDTHSAQVFDARFGESVTIGFESNRFVDLITTTDNGYGEYLDPSEESFEYYPDGTSLNTMQENLTFVVPEDGTYYVIIDNTDIPEGGANPQGNVTYTLGLTRTGAPLDWGICIGIAILILVIIILAVAFILARRKRERTPEYKDSPIFQQSEKEERPMNCPTCGTYSNSGPYCPKCGRRLR